MTHVHLEHMSELNMSIHCFQERTSTDQPK